MATRMVSNAAKVAFFSIAALLLPALVMMTCTVPPDEAVEPGDETTVSSHGGPLILAHYMPWYRGPSNKIEENMLNRYDGHWTRWGHHNPTIAKDGKADIFANQYPLTGPYHSSNTALLEYQAALMKIAGIDGVIFDWYGSYDANDFGENHEYTKAMTAVLKRAGLKFLVCYEDNTLNMIANQDRAPVTTESLAIGKISFDWAEANWFKDSAYVRFEGKPVVMCFGPQHFQTWEQWNTVFSGVKSKPYFADLNNSKSWADASFNWPPMWASANGVLTQARLIQYLDSFYSGVQKGKPYRIAGAFSAFDDAYETSYGYLDYDDGKVFNLTWEKAIAFEPAVIQIITWNDYGEGTIIEPTIERGYKELEYLQERIREWDAAFPFTKEDLRWPLEFYKLRYKQEASAAQEAAIKAATSALFAGDAAGFRNEAVKTGASVSVQELKPLLRD